MIAAEAAAQAITSLELVVREKELMLELAEIKHDEEKEKMVRRFDPLRRWMKSFDADVVMVLHRRRVL